MKFVKLSNLHVVERLSLWAVCALARLLVLLAQSAAERDARLLLADMAEDARCAAAG